MVNCNTNNRFFLENGESDMAIKFAKETIKDWEEENKIETIEKFKVWFKEKNLDKINIFFLYTIRRCLLVYVAFNGH
jgi:hypothetical protein